MKKEKGDKGADGNFGGATFEYQLKSGTVEEDPGEGKIVFSDTTLKNSIKIFIDSSANVGNENIDSFFQTLENVSSGIKGHIRISLKTDITTFLLFQVNDVTNNTSWWTMNITHQSGSSNSPFIDNDNLVVSIVTNGGKGDKGYQGFTGFQGFQGYTGFQGYQGRGFQGYTGFQGVQGFTGFQGYTGRGYQGYTGYRGRG